MEPTKQEAFPLSWPTDWIRTRIQDRRQQAAWKKNARESSEALQKELGRLGVDSMVVSTNVPLNLRGDLQLGIQPLDPGVAVYFKRQAKEDYSWQDILGIHSPEPSIEAIDAAYRELSKKYHPDAGGDKQMFATLVTARDRAKAWVNRKTAAYDYVIACDLFKEVRWNITAIRLTIAAIRQIERCGASSLLERAFKGFAALTAGENDGPSAS